jgi:putative ABC transport system substrate-binding protein
MTATIKRRQFITLLGGAAAVWPLAARAQSQPKMLRVGFVGVQPRESPLYAAFLERMTELGYQEGRNFTFEYIQTPNIDGYEKGYRELAGRKVDVFLAIGNERALLAARAAAEGGPIAFLALNFDPLAKGYVASLSQRIASEGHMHEAIRSGWRSTPAQCPSSAMGRFVSMPHPAHT